MHYLSIGAIFRQENCWLKEWLDYHLAVGVEHFYLYNNDLDTTESDEILRPYVECGLVDNIPYPGQVRQHDAWKDAMVQWKDATEWIAMIDLDEFILPRQCDDLKTLLANYEQYSGLVVSWSVFGSGGWLEPPPDQINHFLFRAENSFSENRHVKSIVKPQCVVPGGKGDPHHFAFHAGHAVDENYHTVDSPFNEHTDTLVRINHYAVRSKSDCFNVKLPKGRADTAGDRIQNYWGIHNRDEVFDDEISRRFGHIVSNTSKKRPIKNTLSHKPTVLLTGSVTQNYSKLEPSGVWNPRERLLDYLCAIQCWLKQPDVGAVVYVDSSGIRLPDELFHDPRLEILSVDLVEYCRQKGKGPAEMQSMVYAMENSRLLERDFFKCTGRLFVDNFSMILRSLDLEKPSYYLRFWENACWCDTRFYWLHRDVFDLEIHSVLGRMNDYKQVITEYFHCDYLKTREEFPKPVYIGRHGHDGTRYEKDYDDITRSNASKLLSQIDLESLGIHLAEEM